MELTAWFTDDFANSLEYFLLSVRYFSCQKCLISLNYIYNTETDMNYFSLSFTHSEQYDFSTVLPTIPQLPLPIRKPF